MNRFAEMLRKLRKDFDLTQEDVAKRIGLNKQTVSQYELGKREPNIEILITLADALDVSLDYLVGRQTHAEHGFSKEEVEIIDSYRRADHIAKEIVHRALSAYDDHQKKEG